MILNPFLFYLGFSIFLYCNRIISQLYIFNYHGEQIESFELIIIDLSRPEKKFGEIPGGTSIRNGNP